MSTQQFFLMVTVVLIIGVTLLTIGIALVSDTRRDASALTNRAVILNCLQATIFLIAGVLTVGLVVGVLV